MSGTVTALPADFCETARFEAVDVISGCRTRFRESRLQSEAGLVSVGGGRKVVIVAPPGIT